MIGTMEQSGFDIIRGYLQGISSGPGVYRMMDKEGNVLYVGKAKNLKNRVANYISVSGLSGRIMRMVSLTKAMEIVTTKTEAEALLLEANLIKKLKPRYNILLRDDKSFPYILLTGEHPFPQLVKHRGVQGKKGQYFGPFASAGAVNETLSILQKLFLVRPCTDAMFASRTRPCLQYQIKRCSAPCVGYVSQSEYAEQIVQAKQFLSGRSREVQKRLAAQMQEASDAMDYEKAAVVRDRIAALTRVQHEQGIIAESLQDADVLALFRDGEQVCIQLFFFRAGQNFGNKSYFPTHVEETTDADIITAFMGQFYVNSPAPRQILVSHPLPEHEWLESALSLQAGHKVEIHHPLRGERKDVIAQAVHNAREALVYRQSSQVVTADLLAKVGSIFHMKSAPVRIEVYDNSHIAGTHMVGAMISASAEGFDKKYYRRFNMDATRFSPGDDYAMMREMLTRRFSRLQKEDVDRAAAWPNLVLIDGGRGQLSATTAVLETLGVTGVTYVAISKGVDRNAGREWFHQEGHTPFQLEPNDPVLHYLQRLRDEAHRFAIGSHRNRRSHAIRGSRLDEISGVGTLRKRALLKHFGSYKGVESATLEELRGVPGIDSKVAEKIYHFFRG